MTPSIVGGEHQWVGKLFFPEIGKVLTFLLCRSLCTLRIIVYCWYETKLSFFIALLLLCVYACSCVHIGTCARARVCHVCRGLSWWWVSLVTPHLFIMAGILLNLELSDSGLASWLAPAIWLCLPSAEIIGSCHACPECTGMLRIWTPVLTFVWPSAVSTGPLSNHVLSFYCHCMRLGLWRLLFLLLLSLPSFKSETSWAQTWGDPAASASWAQGL